MRMDIFKNIAFFLCIIMIIFILLFSYFYKENLKPVSDNDTIKEIVISSTDKKEIYTLLKENNLVKNKALFLFYLQIEKCKPKKGTYFFSEASGLELIAKDICNSKGVVK